MDNTRSATDELRDVWRERPIGGTKRERQAWCNGFSEAVQAIGGPALVREITGALWAEADA